MHSVSNRSKKQELVDKIKSYEKKMASLQEAQLMGDASERTKNMTREEREEDSLAKLEAARAQLFETEQVANDTMSHLAAQRETIQRSRANLKDVNQDLRQSDKLVKGMGKWWRG